jgi:AmpD protein
MFIKKWVESPFFEERKSYSLDMIIIHHIGSINNELYTTSGALSWFTDESLHLNQASGLIENKVSAHYIIPRKKHDDNDLYHLVKEENIAYHAGISQWVVNGKMRKYLNKYSIGIDLEGDGNLIEYTDFQYDVLTWLTKGLMDSYNIPESNIVGHEDVAVGMKIDPGIYFDWKKFRTAINSTTITRPKQIINDTEDSYAPETQYMEKKELTEEEKVFGDTIILDFPKNTVSLNTNAITSPVSSEVILTEVIKQAKTFFMEDASITNNVIIRIINIILSFFSKKSV